MENISKIYVPENTNICREDADCVVREHGVYWRPFVMNKFADAAYTLLQQDSNYIVLEKVIEENCNTGAPPVPYPVFARAVCEEHKCAGRK